MAKGIPCERIRIQEPFGAMKSMKFTEMDGGLSPLHTMQSSVANDESLGWNLPSPKIYKVGWYGAPRSRVNFFLSLPFMRRPFIGVKKFHL